MTLLVGAVLAFAVGLLTTAIGVDRDRAFYPTMTIVSASYYALFAIMEHPHTHLCLSLRWVHNDPQKEQQRNEYPSQFTDGEHRIFICHSYYVRRLGLETVREQSARDA